MNQQQIEHLLDECRTIDENCLYTAQTHFVLAKDARRKVWLLVFLPSLIAVITGSISAFGGPDVWSGVAAIAAGVAGLATALGVDRDAISHMAAGNLMTSLRHEARSLHESFWKEMRRDQLFAELKRINDKYQNIRLALEPTDNKAFEKARKRIKEGFFEPDFRLKKSPENESKKEEN